MADSHQLISAYFDDVLTDQQFAELVAWLSEDSANMGEFVHASWIHSSLRDTFQSDDIRGLMQGAPEDATESELLASTENILSMLEPDAGATQQHVEGPLHVRGKTAEAERSRNRLSVPIAIPRNIIYPAIVSFAAVAIFCFAAFCFVSILNMNRGPVFVATIVDTNMPIWNNGVEGMSPKNDLRQGQVLDLESGLVEIKFGNGARVILEGPSRFEVQSHAAGGLQLGKLVAWVPVKAHGFCIHTPGMRIVDLGTEFAVSVNQQRVAYLHVFDGRVSVAALDAQGKTVRQEIVLADEAVYLRPKTSAIEPTSTNVSRYFARRLPDATRSRTQHVAVPFHSTGVGLNVGDADPHWQIVAAQNDPDFVPQPAIVRAPLHGHVLNDPQWISLTADAVDLPLDAKYTFRMTLDLAELDTLPNRLHGSFRVDDLVTAIRANGSSISVPIHAVGSFREGEIPFVIDGSHLEVGQNIIEFDVHNAGRRDGFDWGTPMALWVRWMGEK